jgi:hypothetical protein
LTEFAFFLEATCFLLLAAGLFSLLMIFVFASICSKRSSAIQALMDASVSSSPKDLPVGLDAKTEEEYASLSSLLQEFTSIPNIDKAWTFKSNTGKSSYLCDFNFFFFLFPVCVS